MEKVTIKFETEVFYNKAFAFHVYETQTEMTRRSANLKFAESIRSPNFSHTRYRPNVGVTAYLRDKNSPSGVLAGGTAWTLEDAKIMLDEIARPFPLSPTEGLYSPR